MEQDEQIIDLVQSYTCLYDIRSAEFKVPLKKENAWENIATYLERRGEL